MPNTVDRSRKRRWIEFVCCLLLLLFFIPLKVKESDEETQFQQYIAAFNKSYNSSEFYERLEAFKNSLETIKLLNSKEKYSTAKYGLTKFSDLHPEEFLEINLLPDLSTQLKRILLPVNFNPHSIVEDNSEKIRQKVGKRIPQKVDWREKNAVTKAKSQKSCSACWAFAAIGMIESINAITTGTLESLSVQNMIDCAPFDGCDGGNVCSLLNWMKIRQVKIDKESDYPLTLRNGECRDTSEGVVRIKDFLCNDYVGFEEEILYLLALNGPVAVAINAMSWQNYVGGTIQFHCDENPSKLNHAVEIVGYDLTKDVPYYIIKNSWGEDFGDNGYLYIAIGKNMCGLAYEVASVSI